MARTHEVPNHLTQLPGVRSRHQVLRVAGSLVPNVNVGATAGLRGEGDDFARGTRHVDLAENRLARPRELQHVLDEIVESCGLSLDDAAEPPALVTHSVRRREKLDRPDDRTERIADLVGQPGGDAPQSGEPFRVLGALCGLFESPAGES